MGICAAPHCDVEIDGKYLMCPRDWYALPKDLRRDVNDTWRRVHRDRQAYTDAKDAAVQWHIDHPPTTPVEQKGQGRLL